MQKLTRQITADDFNVGTHLMVSKSRPGPHNEAAALILTGSVIEIKSINLPFVLVSATCTLRGQHDLVVDVREHEFIRVNPDFVAAVTESARACDQVQANNPAP